MNLERERFGPPFRISPRKVAAGILGGLLGGILSAAAPIAAALIGDGWTFVPAAAVIVAYWAGYVWWIRSTTRAVQSDMHRVDPKILAALLPVARLTPVERAYCEAVSVLADHRTGLDDDTGRDVLQRVTGLLKHSRTIARQRAAAERMVGQTALADLEAERDRIARQLTSVEDPQARENLAQSLSICESRLGNARLLAPAMERLESQQVLIIQTLASIAASLTSLQASAAGLEAPVIEEIKRSVSEITTRVESVEQAVQEVASISQV